MAHSPHVVRGRVWPTVDLSLSRSNRAAASRPQPPPTSTTWSFSCAAFVDDFGACEYVYVRVRASFGLLVVDRSAVVPCCMRFLCLSFVPPWIDLCVCLRACPLTWSVSAYACFLFSLLFPASICTCRPVFFSFQISLVPSTSVGMFSNGGGGVWGGAGGRVVGRIGNERRLVGVEDGWLGNLVDRDVCHRLSLLFSDFVYALLFLCTRALSSSRLSFLALARAPTVLAWDLTSAPCPIH